MRAFVFCAIAASAGTILRAQGPGDAQKFRRNHIEIGTTAVNFLDGNGFRFSEARSDLYKVSRMSAFGFSYGRQVHENWMLKIRFNSFNRHYRGPFFDSSQGRLNAIRGYQNLTASAIYTLRSLSRGYFKFKVLISGDIHYRYISENIYADHQCQFICCNHPNDWYSNYDMGMGGTVYANLIIRNRFTLSADLGYAYFGHLSEAMTVAENRSFKEFTPNRQTATLGIRLGMLF